MTNRDRHVPDSALQHLVARVPRGRPQDTAGLVRHALSERHLEHIGTINVQNGEDRLSTRNGSLRSRAGWDAAYGSGPVVTVIQDVLSLVVYLALAAAII